MARGTKNFAMCLTETKNSQNHCVDQGLIDHEVPLHEQPEDFITTERKKDKLNFKEFTRWHFYVPSTTNLNSFQKDD